MPCYPSAFKVGFTVRSTVVNPKDPLDMKEQCQVIYEYECDVCREIYIGETEISLGQRAEEHAKLIDKRNSKSALSQHQETTGHMVAKKPMIEKMKVVEKEAMKAYKKVKESIQIKLRGTSLNRTDGHDLTVLYLPLLQKEAWGP